MRLKFMATITLCLLLVLVASSSFADPECMGDVNCDRIVDGRDLAEFAKDFGETICPACITAPVAKTGQTASYASGDDGVWQMGVDWPQPRFIDNHDGTVTDNLTGLRWLKNANCYGIRNWAAAVTDANNLKNGECGLSDGSAAGEWRLANLKELHSLTDFSNYSPALPTGHPFTGVQSGYYWSSNTVASYTDNRWYVDMRNGIVYYYYKTNSYYVWPVRGGLD